MQNLNFSNSQSAHFFCERAFEIQIQHYGRAFEFEQVCLKKLKCPGVAWEEGCVEVSK